MNTLTKENDSNERRIINRTSKKRFNWSLSLILRKFYWLILYNNVSGKIGGVRLMSERSFLLIVSEISASFPISIAFQAGTFEKQLFLISYFIRRERFDGMWKECIQRLIVHKTLDVHIPHQRRSSWSKHARDFARYR